jgi:isochorismate hydrolase
VHLLAAADQQASGVLAQAVDGKSNEITAFAPLLEPLDLTGAVITADAMHTQREHARFLVSDKKAHYILVREEEPAQPPRCQRSRLADVANAPPPERQAMTTLGNRPATALLVIDVQNAAVDGSYQRDEVVANIGSLVEKARREHVPVIWVQHSDEELERGSGDWQIVPELNPDGSEPLVEKHYGDSFEDTTLENVLSGLRVGRLVVVGAQTDACIRSTLHGAFARGYDATLVSDAHTTEDQTKWGAPPPDQVIAHTNLYWTYETAPGRTAGTVETEDVDFADARPDA